MRTHYDNLNVAESAPDEVIRAAYKALAMKFHPDRNDGSAESRRIMQIINEAYAVLSDPIGRREYDRLLLASRQAPAHQQDTFKKRQPPPQSTPPPKRRNLFVGLLAFIFSDFRLALFFIGLCIWGFSALTSKTTPSRAYSPSSTTPSYASQSYTPPARPKYVRPSVSPVGTSWPSTAGYVGGYQIQAQGGLSSVRIDNTRNSSDVFLKLVWLSASEAIPARMCYIPAYSSFTFSSVMAGRYDVRYRDLDTGGLSKTEEFILEEKQTYSGTSYSNLTLTLYKVANGNMTTEAIDESEF
jgi:curved DNA-binding protein CbpA